LKLYSELVEDGFNRKVKNEFKGDKEKIKLYRARLDEENDVIVGAGFVDYFLILWDIIKWAKESDILVGPGRGSVGGCLIAYLLDIIEIDPIQYNLLFERFLNKTRVSGERAKAADSLPDIDIDFEGSRRQDVKRYIEQKYGLNFVCSIGTYARLKTKSAIKDFARVKGLDFQKVNFATREIPDDVDYDWSDLFTNGLKKKVLKDFVQENVDICEIMKAPLGQPRSSSIHPSAVIIVPKQDEDGNEVEIYDWMPIKKIDGQIVSEWEGKYIDRAGFLKEDILGIAQLDKFRYILNLIHENYNEKINLNKIPIYDEKVFEYFSNGWNEDVFQFGTYGLKSYSIRVKPDNIEDLISMNALFRPGPMDSKAHDTFVEIRRGKKKPEFDYGLKEVTKNTMGLYIYQEQVMQAVHVLGKLTLSEADELRTAIKKFDKVKMQSAMEKFLQGAQDNGCSLKEANKIWDKLNAFSSYGFNRSHAAAYSLMGYWSQWLKVHYPLEFFTASLNFADEKIEIPNRISEIKKIRNGIKVAGADINKSDIRFTSDINLKKIYWSLTKIKFVGEVAVKVILEERKNGNFFSIEEFYKRINKTKVNKKTMLCLILAGAFDEVGSENVSMENHNKPRNRYNLLKAFFDLRNEKIPDDIENDKYKNMNWFWIKRQKELTGHGDIDYKILVRKKWPNEKFASKMYIDGDDFTNKVLEKTESRKVILAGVIFSLKKKMSKNGEYALIELQCNNSIIIVHLWNDYWDNKKFKSKLLELEINKKMFAISGVMKFDSWKNKNVCFVDDETKIIDLI